MKAMLQQRSRSFLRIAIPALVAGFVMSASTARAVEGEESDRIKVSLAGKVLKDGKKIVVKSDSRIVASTEYRYDLRATVSARKGTRLSRVLPEGTSLADLLEEIKSGSSDILRGKVKNPGGELPLTLFDEKISGSIKIPKFAKVKVALRLKARLLDDGTCKLEIRDVKLRPKGKKVGHIAFERGSRLVVRATGDVDSAMSEIGFRFAGVSVSEADGQVEVIVRRKGDLSSKASVKFITVVGTADEDDFTIISGRLVFEAGENQAVITVDIADNADVDGSREFTIVLSDVKGKAKLWDGRDVLTVTITDDD